MNIQASPLIIDFAGDASIASLLEVLQPHQGKSLVLAYGGRAVRPGYHVTEVKAASLVTLDCGGNPDRWNETILQVEDLDPGGEAAFMRVRKFTAILASTGAKIGLDPQARITFEIGPPGEPMEIYDVSRLEASDDQVILSLGGRPAICKPRHRAERMQETPACCAPAASKSGCCA